MKQRGAKADEFLAVMKAIWTTDPVEVRGRFYTLPRSVIERKPVQKPHPPPTWLRSSLGRVARFADGWNPVGIPVNGMQKMFDAHAPGVGQLKSSVTERRGLQQKSRDQRITLPSLSNVDWGRGRQISGRGRRLLSRRRGGRPAASAPLTAGTFAGGRSGPGSRAGTPPRPRQAPPPHQGPGEGGGAPDDRDGAVRRMGMTFRLGKAEAELSLLHGSWGTTSGMSPFE